MDRLLLTITNPMLDLQALRAAREGYDPHRLDWNTIPSPCFVMDVDRLCSNMAFFSELQRQIPVQFILALKGFAMFSVFDLMKEAIHGTTASSLHELRLGSTRFGGSQHIFMPAYPPEQVPEMASMADHVSFNSVSQFLQHGAAFRSHRADVQLGLRINPGYSPVSTDLYNPCAAGSRLGTRLHDLERGYQSLEQAGLEPDFLHCHNLCESGADALAQTLDILARDFEPWLQRVRSMNLGGGHLMSREDYNLEQAAEAIAGFKAQFPHLQLIMEPGSALVWETGYFRSKVLDIMKTEALPVAILDSSITAHLPDVLEMPYQPRILGAAMESTSTHTHCYRLGGQSCLAGDQVGIYAFEKPLQTGDDLVFMDMMHYTMVKTNTFNGMGLPSIGLWRSNSGFELIRRFGYEDFESRLS